MCCKRFSLVVISVFLLNSCTPSSPKVDQYTIGGSVVGLVGEGLLIQNNLGDELSITENGPFNFSAVVSDNSEYAVSVSAQPTSPAQICTVDNGAGIVSGADVSDITITCNTTIAACDPGAWNDFFSDEIFQAGIGIREPGAPVTYGTVLIDGMAKFAECETIKGNITLPVFMIDWEDYDPATDSSNHNFPDDIYTDYIRTGPDELSAYLNGPTGPAQYFKDVSAGRINITFEVIGWMYSSTPGSYLKNREEYISTVGPGTYICDSHGMMNDILRDAIILNSVFMPDYDSDNNGFMDGAIIVYEGGGGLCNGANMKYPNPLYHAPDSEGVWSTNTLHIHELVDADDPNRALFELNDVNLQFFNNIYERWRAPQGAYTSFIWAHEVGHMLLGYSDSHPAKYNMGRFGLSGASSVIATHPGAWEKWLFGKWLEPVEVSSTGTVTLMTSDKADNAIYDVGPYLLKIMIDNNPAHFMTIENRWFSDAGNTGSQWHDPEDRENGLTIIEFHMDVTTSSATDLQLYRHVPSRVDGASQSITQGASFRPGDTFSECFLTQCITITPEGAGSESVDVSITIDPVP